MTYQIKIVCGIDLLNTALACQAVACIYGWNIKRDGPLGVHKEAITLAPSRSTIDISIIEILSIHFSPITTIASER